MALNSDRKFRKYQNVSVANQCLLFYYRRKVKSGNFYLCSLDNGVTELIVERKGN